MYLRKKKTELTGKRPFRVIQVIYFGVSGKETTDEGLNNTIHYTIIP